MQSLTKASAKRKKQQNSPKSPIPLSRLSNASFASSSFSRHVHLLSPPTPRFPILSLVLSLRLRIECASRCVYFIAAAAIEVRCTCGLPHHAGADARLRQVGRVAAAAAPRELGRHVTERSLTTSRDAFFREELSARLLLGPSCANVSRKYRCASGCAAKVHLRRGLGIYPDPRCDRISRERMWVYWLRGLG